MRGSKQATAAPEKTIKLGNLNRFIAVIVFLASMLLLGLTYLISGIGLQNYPELMGKNLVFAALQFVAIFVLYFFFTSTIRWDRVPKGYLAWSGLAVGCVVLVQLLENYLSGRIFDGSSMDRELIATGWGMHNNIGCMMAMMMPFGFYLASTEKRGWIFNLLGSALLLASQEGSALQGTLMLLLYSLGLGIPFLASALLLDKLKGAFSFIKRHFTLINRIAGGFLILTGLAMMFGLLGRLLSLLS